MTGLSVGAAGGGITGVGILIPSTGLAPGIGVRVTPFRRGGRPGGMPAGGIWAGGMAAGGMGAGGIPAGGAPAGGRPAGGAPGGLGVCAMAEPIEAQLRRSRAPAANIGVAVFTRVLLETLATGRRLLKRGRNGRASIGALIVDHIRAESCERSAVRKGPADIVAGDGAPVREHIGIGARRIDSQIAIFH